jgi:hypothetical protein
MFRELGVCIMGYYIEKLKILYWSEIFLDCTKFGSQDLSLHPYTPYAIIYLFYHPIAKIQKIPFMPDFKKLIH